MEEAAPPRQDALKRTSQRTKPVSSLSLQILIQIEWKLQIIFCICSLVMFFYKAYKYEYKAVNFLCETLASVSLCIFQYLRLFLGSKANKTEKSGLVGWFIICSIITLAGTAYFMFMQSYVLLFELLFAAIILLLGLL